MPVPAADASSNLPLCTSQFMQTISDDMVRTLVSVDDAIATLRAAFAASGRGQTALQPRVRSGMSDISLSMMGAILPQAGVCGAKVYTTLAGRFDFVIALFAIKDGRFLGVVQGNALTEFRTAALTRIASDLFAPQDARVLTIFGTGIQARAHLRALVAHSLIEEVFIVGIEGVEDMVKEARRAFPNLSVNGSDAQRAAACADILVTASRSTVPLFDGNDLKDDVFVAAIGSSKPTSREIDDATLRRARTIAVESLAQAKVEAGDLLLAAPDVVDWSKIQELGVVLADESRQPPTSGIAIFKSVGIGLADVALAAYAYKQSGACV
jgi:ornithine cyclodeaminase